MDEVKPRRAPAWLGAVVCVTAVAVAALLAWPLPVPSVATNARPHANAPAPIVAASRLVDRAASAANEPIVYGSDLTFPVRRAVLDAALADPRSLAVASVARRDGRAIGLALRVPATSPLQTLGLLDGDILLDVDGLAVLDRHGLPAVGPLLGKVEALRRAGRWSARIERGGTVHLVRVRVSGEQP